MEWRRTLLYLWLALLAAPVMFAQVDTGTIAGSVHDSQGAAVAAATITFVETGTNTTIKTQTDGSGDYASPPLRPGNYKITAAAAGFKTETRGTIVLQVQDRLRQDFSMAVGSVSENVEVTAETPTIQTDTSSLGEVVSTKEMTQLPLNGRDYIQLATLTTGVVRTSSGTNGNTGGSSTGGLNSFVANGTRGTLNNFLLDGIDNNSNDNGGVILRTNVDAIQEFKLQTNTYSAEFGRSAGAVVNAITKTGTNRYHGNVFEFFRNSALDARDTFEDPATKKASFKQNQFGGTLGGPIVKDKLFWFGDYQGTSIRRPLTWISLVPTPEERVGNFSAAGEPTIYDPNNGQPFNGNIIPSDRIDPVAQAFMNLYPDPNQSAITNGGNFNISPIEQDRIDQGDGRLDYTPSQTDQFFARYSMSGRTDVRPAPLPGLANGGDSSTGNGFEDTKGASVGYTRAFTPRTVNEVRVGFNYVHIRRGVPPAGTALPPPELRVPGVPDDPRVNGLTVFSPRGYRRLGDPRYAPTILASQERQLSDVLTLVRGAHTFKLGGEVRWSQFNISQEAAPRGQFNFNGKFTQHGVQGAGSSLADMLLGLANSSGISTVIELGNRQHVPALFIQDDWKVTHRLTINLGLRYDYFSPIVEVNNKQSNFDYATGTLIQAATNGASRALVTADKANFSPRIGFAFTPGANADTVIRGAYGIFYSGQEIRTAAPLQLAYNLPFFYEPSFVSDGVTPLPFTPAEGFPTLDPNQAINPGVTSVDPNLHTPYYQSWNLAVQRALPGAVSIEVAYAGSKGTHLQGVTDRNQDPTPGPGDIQARRPYPFYGGFTSIQNLGSSNYNSLQIKGEKHLSHGLYFLSAFTYSKAINDLPEICCAAPFPQNSYDIAAERGPADFDQRLRWVFSFDYEIPFGGSKSHISNRAVDAILGGWHVGGIYTLASGFPFSPLLGNDPSNTGAQVAVRPNQLRNGNLPRDRRSKDMWFDPSAYEQPDPNLYFFGNAGRNSLVGPGQNVFDASLRKEFAFTDRHRLEFRTEFFNAFNHPNYAQPDNFIDDDPEAVAHIGSLAIPMRQIQFGLKYSF